MAPYYGEVSKASVTGAALVWSSGCSGDAGGRAENHNIYFENKLWFYWSGWRDLNPRPLEPHSSALAKLRYTPTFHNYSIFSHRINLNLF